MRHPIKLIRCEVTLQGYDTKVKLWWPKISRKRFIGAAMYFGLPHRLAVELADITNEAGRPYREAIPALLETLAKARAEEEDALNI